MPFFMQLLSISACVPRSLSHLPQPPLLCSTAQPHRLNHNLTTSYSVVGLPLRPLAPRLPERPLVGRRWINELFLWLYNLSDWCVITSDMPPDNSNASTCASEIELKALTSEANCEGCDDNQIGAEERNKYSLLQPRPLLLLVFC